MMRGDDMCRRSRRSLWRHLVALQGDRRGAVAIYFGVTMAVLIGVGAFTVDLGRVFSVGSELQSAAEALALAGAAELDGETDAIDRANLAVFGSLTGDDPIIVNGKTFAGAGDVPASSVRFLHSLPPDDVPIDASFETTDPLVARFIEVTVTPATIRNLFIPVVGGPLTIAHSAVAVAGFTQVICQFPPLMICNPSETPTNSNFTPIKGRQILLKAVGQGTQWGPGDFGLLETPEGGSGTRDLREELASAYSSGCYVTEVNIRPGEAVSISVGMNVRFDLYAPPFKSPAYKNDPEYRPAKNVTKGLVRDPNNACVYMEPADAVDNVVAGGTMDDGTMWAMSDPAVTVNSTVPSKADWSGAQAAAADLSQSAAMPIVAGAMYTVTMTVEHTAGTLTPMVGGTLGTPVSAGGTLTQDIMAGATQTLMFEGDASFIGTLDGVKVTTQPPEAMAVPKDACFYDDPVTCTYGRFGSMVNAPLAGMSDAMLVEYWRINHDPTATSLADLPDGVGAPDLDFDGDLMTTRYDIYNWEIANEIPDNSAIGGEDGNAQCSTVVPPTPDPLRRVLITAVINCVEYDIKGSADNVPVEAFAEMYLTDYIPKGGNEHELFVEMIGVVDPGLQSIIHDIVQLYRYGL